MAAAIVYDVVEGGSGGTLFNGMKFWVAQRVPMRNSLLAQIKGNGGEIVPLEKQADMLIADHVRKDAPAGAYSWRFIEQSVKTGRLEELDTHLISPASGTARPVGTGDPSKKTRNAFSPADDAILAEWVTRQEKLGAHVSGNIIFQDLELKHPNHPWQSWRDRWVKVVSLRPRPDAQDEDRQEQSVTEKPEPQPLKSSRERESSRSIAKASSNKAKIKYTAEDDDLLRKYVKEAIEANKHINGNKIYQELAEEYPHHSWHSWRDRWVRHLSKEISLPGSPNLSEHQRTPQERARSAELGGTSIAVSAPQQSHLAALPRNPRPSRDLSVQSKLDEKKQETPSKPVAVVYTQSNSKHRTLEHTTRMAELEAKRKRIKAARTIQQVWKGYRVRRDLALIAHFQALVSGALTRQALREIDEDDQSARDETLLAVPGSKTITGTKIERWQSPQTGQRTDKHVFYSDLQDFVENTGEKVNLWPKIQGRSLDLWDLWQAARTQQQASDLRNWEDVADTLNFDWILNPKVTRELKECFETNLGEFERAMEDWDQHDAEFTTDDEQSQDIRPISAPPAVLRSRPVPSSSSPAQKGTKRHIQFCDVIDGPHHLEKRARYSKESEIPSTPDELTGTKRVRKSNELAFSPFHERMPSVRSHTMQHSSPQLPPMLKQRLEPETQDFGYDPGLHSEESFSSENPTPSQQLRSEAEHVEPIPFPPLHKKSKVSRPPSLARSTDLPGADMSRRFGPSSSAKELKVQQTQRPSFGQPKASSDPSSSPPPTKRALPSSFRQEPVPKSRMSNGSAREAPASMSRPVSSPRTPIDPTPAPAAARPRVSTPPAATESLTEMVDRFVSLGYARDIVIKALKATTLSPGTAGIVMESLVKGTGIPRHHEGIWTQKDDDGLVMVEKTDLASLTRVPGKVDDKRRAVKEQKRLEFKHGRQRMKARWEFLVAWGSA